jgi:HlyD family secretion protein
MLKPARNHRFPNRPTAALIAVAILVLITVAILAFPTAGGWDFVLPARAESSVEVKIRRDIDNLNKSIERWRGGLPEGIAKTNGRIEATEIDVSSKYAGRLERVIVDEGDEVKNGQVVARIDSPEYSAQLQTAQANVLVAQDSLASAGAKIAQAQADLDYASADLDGARTWWKRDG